MFRLIHNCKNIKITNGQWDHYWQAACLSQSAAAPASQTGVSSGSGINSSRQTHHSIATPHRSVPCRPHYSNTSQFGGRRWYSNTPKRSDSFFGKILDNLKEESERSTKMKQSIEDFKKDMEDLSKSETVVKARDKYNKIEEERAEGSRKARQHYEKLKQKVSKTVEDAQNIEMIQKASKMTEGAKERVQQVGQNFSQKSEEFAKTQAFQKMTDTARAVKEEINSSALTGAGMKIYKAPTVLRMRTERNPEAEARIIEANTHATGVVLHKDSRFQQSWQDFRDNNAYINRVMEWKTQLDESDHVIVRASVILKEKITELFGPVFHKTDLSKTLTEICKIDSDFDKDTFMLQVEYDLIPNILEAMIRPDLKILEDWTSERAFSITAAETKRNITLGHYKAAQVLDIDNIDLAMGKVLDEGPVLAVTFQAQMIEYTTNSAGDVVEGNPAQVLRRHYVWVLCRDQADPNPRAAWKLLEYSYHSAAQLV